MKRIQNKSFYMDILAIALPITLQSVISTGVNVMDTVMLGSLGEIKIAASSLANQFIQIHQVCSLGLGTGAAVLTARAWGANNIERIKKVHTAMMHLTLLIALVFFLLAACFPIPIMKILTRDMSIVEDGATYLLWSLPSFFFGSTAFASVHVLRSVGCNKLPLISAVAAFVVNILANYVFIYGHFGAPAMGIAGAALGTSISRMVEFLIVYVYMFCFDKRIRYRLRDLLMPYRDVLPMFVKVSLPVIISDTLLGLGHSTVAVIIGHIGPAFVAANAIIATVAKMSTIFTQGATSAACILTGQLLGGNHQEGIKKQTAAFTFLGLLLGLFSGCLIALISVPMLQFYDINEQTYEIAVQLSWAVSVTVVFQCVGSMMTQIIRSGGDTQFLLVADLVFLWLVSVPLGACAALVWNCSAFVIYCCLKAEFVLKVLLCAWRLRSGKWIRQLENETEC